MQIAIMISIYMLIGFIWQYVMERRSKVWAEKWGHKADHDDALFSFFFFILVAVSAALWPISVVFFITAKIGKFLVKLYLKA